VAVEKIRVDGLKDLRKALKALDGEWPKELRVRTKKVADGVAAGTATSFASRGGVAPKVAASVKAYGQQTGAQIKIGGARFPFALGSEFGAVRYKQFPTFKGSGPTAGYSLYETIRDRRQQIIDEYADMLATLTAEAFPN